MTSRPATTTFTGATPAEAVTLALSHLVSPDMRSGEQASATLVFSGEGGTAKAAALAALEDLRTQCADHALRPLEVWVDNVFRTDEGTRIWGTVTCAPSNPPVAIGGVPEDWMMEQTGEGAWTVTITRA